MNIIKNLIVKISLYLNNQTRWNEIGHSMFGFIMGCLHPYIAIAWVLFAIIQELFIDSHWDIWNDTKSQKLDLLFDLQSKIVSCALGYLYINLYMKLNGMNIFNSIIFIILIFAIGYKAPYFYTKDDLKK